jgi:LysR family transcriptional regulator, glycine cleavage system transcriptional activator
MKYKLPPLNAIRAFEAAARHRSFARAAIELNVTSAAVSHQVKQLEQWLDVPLFVREANGVALTSAGRDYAQRVRELFDKLSDTSGGIREKNEQTIVQIRAQFSVASMWLLPQVIAFNQSQTDISLRLNADMERPSAKLGADLAVYFQRSETPGYQQTLLLDGKFRLYASPALLHGGFGAKETKAARLPSAEELTSYPLLHNTVTDRDWRFPTIDDWFEAAGVSYRPQPNAMHFNLQHLVMNACVQGAGLALLQEELCAHEVRNGKLVALPGPALDTPHPYYLVSRIDASEAVNEVRDWLLTQAKYQGSTSRTSTHK